MQHHHRRTPAADLHAPEIEAGFGCDFDSDLPRVVPYHALDARIAARMPALTAMSYFVPSLTSATKSSSSRRFSRDSLKLSFQASKPRPLYRFLCGVHLSWPKARTFSAASQPNRYSSDFSPTSMPGCSMADCRTSARWKLAGSGLSSFVVDSRQCSSPSLHETRTAPFKALRREGGSICNQLNALPS